MYAIIHALSDLYYITLTASEQKAFTDKVIKAGTQAVEELKAKRNSLTQYTPVTEINDLTRNLADLYSLDITNEEGPAFTRHLAQAARQIAAALKGERGTYSLLRNLPDHPFMTIRLPSNGSSTMSQAEYDELVNVAQSALHVHMQR